ncbi:MAG: amidohydrolase [Verrucomicrobiota bacterium]|nr:amidohydrolase [Verrucomicrobiota bacterium]
MRSIEPLIANLLPELVALRRELHAHPEPGYQEIETAKKIVAILKRISGIQIRTGVGVTGVVATLGAEKTGPCVALRADMDCLPISEETALPYASQNPGYMHACGHDGHTVCLLGAALVLSAIREELSGPVKFIFQPAEEGGAGGNRLCNEGALESPKVDAIFGLHNMPTQELALGDIATRVGPFMAASGNFTLIIKGKGGHAAAPHRCVDPIYIGSQIINALQSIVSRSLDPVANGVLSVTWFHAGTAFNVIPETAEIRGTFRSLDDSTHLETAKRIDTLATAIAEAHGATLEARIDPGYPVLVNDARCVALLATVARAAGFGGQLKTDQPPLMAGEDFAYYIKRVPGCFWFQGTRPPGVEKPHFCHSAYYDFNDDSIAQAVQMHVETARRFASLW